MAASSDGTDDHMTVRLSADDPALGTAVTGAEAWCAWRPEDARIYAVN